MGGFVLFILAVVIVPVAVGIIAFRMIEGRWPRWLVAEKIDPLIEVMAELIEASLREHPEEWVSDGYCTTNKAKGISVWVISDSDGLGVRCDGKRASPRDGSWPATLKKRVWTAVQLRNVATVVNRFKGAA